MNIHHCIDGTGFRRVCICTTGVDHSDYEMDVDPATVGKPRDDDGADRG